MDSTTTFRSEISLSTAKLYIYHLRTSEFLGEVVRSLRRCSISKEVLENTDLEKALKKYAFHDVYGKRIRTLLFRFFRITLGRGDAVKEEKNQKTVSNKPQTEQPKPESVLTSSSTSFQKDIKPRFNRLREEQMKRRMRKNEGPKEKHTVIKRKLEANEEISPKMRKIEEKEDDEKQKENIQIFFRDLNRDVEHCWAERVSNKLQRLPLAPSQKDIGQLLEGLTANALQKAEELVGRQMRRVEPVWWALIHRDFGRLDRKWCCGVRDIYKGYQAIHAARKLKERF